MKYKVVLSPLAKRQLSKLDNSVQLRILKYINTRVDGSTNPRKYGDALTGDLRGYWRYRVGDYRILCQIVDDVFKVLVVKTGHRREVY